MFYKVNGQAGYGKTHNLIEEIKKLYRKDKEEWNQSFLLVTPTNKAALVLNSRLKHEGLPPLAKTLHSALYLWKSTGKIKDIRKIRKIDPNTGKFEVDSKGKPTYHEEIEYVFEKELRTNLKNKIIYVDESSMVTSDVWYDVMSSEAKIKSIFSYGDERQLPPIEVYETIKDIHKPYYRFWHLFQEPEHVTTLTENHRHHGPLKDMVEAIEYRLFGRHCYSRNIPDNLMYDGNFSIDASSLNEETLLSLMTQADIIITPFNKVRQVVNIVMRKHRAREQCMVYSQLPVIGDRIIFVDSIKKEFTNDDGDLVREITVAKNVTAVVSRIHDIDLKNNSASIDFVDETSEIHEKQCVSLQLLVEGRKNHYPKIDFAYAVTVHSSQGGAWPNVLFLNSYWPGEDSSKLRYVAITRASNSLMVVNNMPKITDDTKPEKHILLRLGKSLGWV